MAGALHRRTRASAARKRKPPQFRTYPGKTNGDSRNIYQPIADGIYHQLRRFVNAERVHDIRAMNRDRIRAETELIRDFLVRFAFYDQLKNFQFASRERGVTLTLQGGGPRHRWIKDRFSRRHSSHGDGQFE